MQIIPVILAGGSGTRLWPLSRASHPKQFLKLVGDHSLLQETLLRTQPLTQNGIYRPLLVINESQYFLSQDQLNEVGLQPVDYILEPFGRNTAPAIAIAAQYIEKKYGDDVVILVMPSDHWLKEPELFLEQVRNAAEAAAGNKLITFGIKPTAPKTGFGYIQAGEYFNDNTQTVARFVEKPDKKTAEEYIAEGNYYWNSGMFLFKPSIYLNELKKYAAPIFNATQNTFEKSEQSAVYFRIDAQSFQACPEDSIDYAVMEKTKNALVSPLNITWNDLGCWAAVAESGDKDENNNVLRGNVIAQHSQGCLISSEERLVTAIGLNNHIIVSTADAVLVADKAYSQEVKQLVNVLKESQTHKETTTHHKKVERPWGHYISLAIGEKFQVKHIMVKPGARLSLQLHHHRAEHWVVVSGTAEVVNGDKTFSIEANQSTYIPKETQHRLSNRTTEPLHIIEVQSGDYLGEDDIVRLEDVYNRVGR